MVGAGEDFAGKRILSKKVCVQEFFPVEFSEFFETEGGDAGDTVDVAEEPAGSGRSGE